MAKGEWKSNWTGCCNLPSSSKPDFCSNRVVYKNLKDAYNALWDSIEDNEEYLSDGVWSWVYEG
jgi:hypothetical protein